MQEVEFADRKQNDAGPKVDWLPDEVVDVSKFEANLAAIRLSDGVLELDFGRDFDVLRHVGVNERDEPLLIEVAGDTAVPVFDAALPLSSILDVHIAADDRFGCRHEGLGVDQTAGPGGSERQGRLGGSSTFPSHFGERSHTGFG